MSHEKKYEFWFVVGSQHLYGSETLKQIQEQSTIIVKSLQIDSYIPYRIVLKPVLTTAEEIRKLCLEANAVDHCVGLITWMHTFSPAKMWIAGLSELRKPLLHLHTQFHRDIPWQQIDMDYMNLNQSAHGDREYGFIGTRMGIARKVIVGHWENQDLRMRVGKWMRTAISHAEGISLKIARFGDNMRDVAVTEGDKVEAQIKFGWSIQGFGVGDLVDKIRELPASDVDMLLEEYRDLYDLDSGSRHFEQYWDSVREQAKMELGLKAFLQEGGFSAFTTTFEDLHGLKQLPGLAAQRLMAQGYGFAGEGDWKTAGLVRMMKVMAGDRATSFMEDYTYHLEPDNELVLGAHMLEICPSIAATRPQVKVHPLGIGGKEDPARLVFDGRAGAAVCASLVDLGNRFRLLINEVEAVECKQEMPNLPVARVLWKPKPSLTASAEAWIIAGGAHHTCLSYAVDTENLLDWSEMVGIECLVINDQTEPITFRNELKQNEMFWRISK